MRLVEIRRFPVKSLRGEVLPACEVGGRGLSGDRLWAVRDPDGKLGSGKNTRRFRRMPGLLNLRSYADSAVPTVELPDGSRYAADDPAGHAAVGALLGRTVTITPEDAVKHHDEGPVSVITTAGLRRLEALTGTPVEPVRFRANLLIDVPTTDDWFPEDGWPGRTLRVGPQVELRPRRPLTRCVMIGMAQGEAPARGDLLRTVSEHHGLKFGLWATVERPGRISTGDTCTLL